MLRRTLWAGLLCFALTGAACSSGESPVVEPGAKSTPAATMDHSTASKTASGSIVADDVTSDGKTVTVKSVTLTGSKGFIAWHTDANGQPGPVVGHSALLSEGTTSNVTITLDTKIASGEYWPMLHSDSNANGTYDFPTGGNDPPVKDATGAIVMDNITVTVR